MSRATSLNALTDTGITREIDSKYDVVKEVSLHLAAIDYLSLIDLEQVSSDVSTAMDFTGITVVSGEAPNWDPVTKVLTIPTVKGDTGDVISVTNIVTNPDYTITLIFSDGSTFTTSSLQGSSGDPLTMTQVVNNGDYTYTFEFSDGTSFTTDSLRGDVGPKGDPITITNITNNADDTLTIIFSDGTTHTTVVLKGDQGIQGVQGIQGIQGPVGPVGPQGDQGTSVDHITATSTTEPGGTFSVAGETDTYTVYGDIAEAISLGAFSVTNGTVVSLEFTTAYRDQILRIGDSTLPLTTSSQTLLESINEIVSTKVESSLYTAADVLTKLLTVDGHTSGLDADTLDGKELSTIESDRASEIALANVQNSAHISDTSNPHSTTATHLNLGNVDNTSDSNKTTVGPIADALAGKINTGLLILNDGDILGDVILSGNYLLADSAHPDGTGFDNRAVMVVSGGINYISQVVYTSTASRVYIRRSIDGGLSYSEWVLSYNSGLDTGFVTPSLLSGWLPYGGPYGDKGLAYRKAADGLVVVSGLITGGTISYTLPIFVLPVGFRPLNEIIIPIYSNGAAGRLNVKVDGSVVPTDGDTAWVSMDFSFYAVQ